MPPKAGEAGEAAKQAVRKHCPPGVDEEVVQYLAETAAALFEDASADPEEIRPELEAAAGPLLEDSGASPEAVAAFCDAVLKAALGCRQEGGAAEPKQNGAAGAVEADASKDLLCRVPNLMLMYGGSPQPLLKNATLELVRGHRYGVVGANGTGKTTLMARIASKDIVGFPKDVRVVHLRHEAILKGIARSTPAREYARLRNQGSTAASEADLATALRDVGFNSDEMLDKAVGTLSGGWQMRLALACAVAQKANLLLLDEPTNHLDTEGVAWLVQFIRRTCVGGEAGGTAMIVSHDAAFLNEVCTHIVHFTADAKLVYFEGDFETFKVQVLQGDEAKAQEVLEVSKQEEDGDSMFKGLNVAERLLFPPPERIPGAIPGKTGPVVLKLMKVSFTYEGADAPVFHDLDVELTSTSRVGIVGKNGSGKSTLLSLIGGRLRPASGELWFHSSLRLVYIAQHTDAQLRDYMKCTPVEYMQLRFRRGFDIEALPRHMQPTVPTANQARRIRELAKKLGKRGKEVEAIIGRQASGKDGKDVIYEVQWKELTPADNTFEKRSRLKSLGVEYMADEYDMWIANAWGTGQERPLTSKELVSHFEDFGLPEEVSDRRQLHMLSSGQKCKVMLAASFWTRPHVVCFDEPTNYLDTETVEALVKALRIFRGGYAIVSHSEAFISETCEEVWTVADGRITVNHRGSIGDGSV